MTTTGPRRLTKQQAAVSATLQSADDFLTAQQLHARMRTSGESVGLATVYRTLQAFAAEGVVDAIVSADGETSYRRCVSAHHHHHLVCRECGKTVEVEGPAVEAWAAKVSAANGFRDVTHTLEIFGTCSEH